MPSENMDLDTLRTCELGILDSIHNFCTENRIKYWLDKGSLLGAVRHHGFIPWDDDIDIGMLRTDYDRFADSFRDAAGRYRFVSVKEDKNCYYPYGKVLDQQTVLIEDQKYSTCVNVDVNVYDTAPDTHALALRQFKRRDYFRKMSALQRETSDAWAHQIGRPVKWLRRSCLRLLPPDFFLKKMIKNARKYEGKQTGRVGNFLEYGTCVIDETVFSETMLCAFEKKDYPIPKRYDELLTQYYGDYLTLPPLEEQKTHHRFSAVYKG